MTNYWCVTSRGTLKAHQTFHIKPLVQNTEVLLKLCKKNTLLSHTLLGFSIGCCGEDVQEMLRKKINAMSVESWRRHATPRIKICLKKL